LPPKSRNVFTVAAVLVGLAAIGGIAAIEGWLPTWMGGDEPAQKVTPTAPLPKIDGSTPRPRVQRTVPPESLSPGESVVAAPEGAPAAAPAATPAAPAAPMAAPAAAPPSPPARAELVAKARTFPKARPDPKGLCRNCGVVTSTTYRDEDARGAWEVRVKFEDGNARILRYPSDPGFRVGERVFLSRGRLYRD
jgi:hypothetical protein